jgi:pyrroline-5-carboxylate reductase
MVDMANVLLVGCGNMGFALLQRWRVDNEARHRVVVVEPLADLRRRAADQGAEVYAAATELCVDFRPDVIVLGTKPQLVAGLVATYSVRFDHSVLFLSIAAGVSLATMEANLAKDASFIRCMPNTPAAIGQGMIVCCAGSSTTPGQLKLAEGLLSNVGKVAFIADEAQMDAVTAVSGSGPAYVFQFIESLAAAGEKVGLSPELSLELAKQTVFGAASMAAQCDLSPAALRQQVTSPNGTTAAALEVLMDPKQGLQDLMDNAVKRAQTRSLQLGLTP